MFEFYLGNLKLHGRDVSNFWLQTPIEGLDSPDYRINSYDKPGEDGSVVSSAFYGSRMITLPGKVKGSNAIQFEANRKLLASACGIQRDSNGFPVLTRCRVTTLSGQTYYFDAQVNKPVFAGAEVNWSSFLIKLAVPAPQIFGSSVVSSGNVTLAVGNGTTFPITFPVIFGGTSGGSVTIANTGTMFSWPIITLSAQLTNPVIYNATTGRLMQLNYTLSGADSITIDMLEKTILLNGTSSLIGTKTTDSDWWAVEPGDNLIYFSSGSNGDNGQMSVQFNPGYIGI